MNSIVAALGNSNTLVYTLTFSPSLSNILDTGRGNNKNEMHPDPDLLAPLLMTVQAMRKNVPKTIAAMTGGEYEMFETRKKFEVRMNDFTNHLHSRYLLSITPKNPHPGLHQIRVHLKNPGNDTVLARTSYWAEAPRQLIAYSARSPCGAVALASRTSRTLAIRADSVKGLGRNQSPGSSTP